MNTCRPAILIAAIFTALVIIDLITKNYRDIGFHLSAGVLAVIGLFTACELGGETMSWLLLSVPFLFLLIGLIMIWVDKQKTYSSDLNLPPTACPCQTCGTCPCECGWMKRFQNKSDCSSSAETKPTPPGCPPRKA